MKWIAAATLLALPAPAAAEVVSSGGNGLHIRQSVTLVVPANAAYQAFRSISGWWNAEHSYSGDAANLSLGLTPGGCFCERLPKTGGGVEHMRVTYFEPGKRIIMSGSLGPLLFEATAGVMDVKFERNAGGSKVTLDYKAAGFAEGNAQMFAPLVDSVLGEQMKRYRAFAARRPTS